MKREITIETEYFRQYRQKLGFSNQTNDEVKLNRKEKVRIETQLSFTGTNDIKQYKILEAKRIRQDSNIHTLAIHFDFYNRQIAILKLDEIDDSDAHWITRVYFDDGLVYNIDQNFFLRELWDNFPFCKCATEYE